jgi:type I restriction enzyme S subunit
MIGVLPESWAAAKLSDVCQINPRGKSGLAEDDEVSFVPMAAVSEFSGSIVAAETRPLREVQKGFTPFKESDVLFAKITPCMENGKAAIARNLVNQRGYGSTEFHIIRPSALVLAEWILAIIRTPEFRRAAASSFQGAVGQQRVTSSFLESFRIPLPPVSEQQRIVEILQEAEGIRRLCANAGAKTSALIPAVFEGVFGDPVRNPRRWSIEPLAALINDTPKNGLYKPADFYGEGTPIIRIGDFSKGILRSSRALQRVRIAEDEIQQFGVANGQILINRVNSIEHLGKSLLIASLTEPTVYESNMMRLDPNREKVLPDFLIGCLQHSSIVAKLSAKAKKAINQASVNQTDVLTLQIPVPPIATQEAFGAHVAEIEELRACGEQSLRAEQALRAALAAHAFSGELTANWREAHQAVLAREARDRDAALKEAAATFSRSRRATMQEEIDAMLQDRNDGIYSHLNREQHHLLREIERRVAEGDSRRYFTAQQLAADVKGPLRRHPQRIESHLCVFSARGLVIPVSLPRSDAAGPAFAASYRLPVNEKNRSDGDGEGMRLTSDDLRSTLMRVQRRLATRTT